jgi:hypothetical protein
MATWVWIVLLQRATYNAGEFRYNFGLTCPTKQETIQVHDSIGLVLAWFINH